MFVVIPAFAEAYLLDPKQSKNPVVGEIKVADDSEPSEKFLKKDIEASPLIIQGDLLLCFVHPTFPSSEAFLFADLVCIYSIKCMCLGRYR